MALVRPAAALIHAVAEHESIDQAVEFLRPLAIGAISKLGHSDRADAEIRWSLSLQARADLALAAEREAHAIRIEEVLHDRSKRILL